MHDGKVILAVDPGHGGRDPGAVGGGLREDNLVYDWVGAFAAFLNELPFMDVRQTHTRPGGDRKVSLKARVDAANAMQADLFMSVHANSYWKKSANGVEIFIAKRCSQDSAKLAEAILPALLLNGRLKSRGIKRRNLYTIRKTNMPAIYLELGFISNSVDADVLRWLWGAQAQDAARAVLAFVTRRYSV